MKWLLSKVNKHQYMKWGDEFRLITTHKFICYLIIVSFFLGVLFQSLVVLSAFCKLYKERDLYKNVVFNLQVFSGLSNQEIKNRDDLLKVFAKQKIAIVTVYSYNSVEAQTDSTPDINAMGTKTGPGQLAVSPDLLKLYPLSSSVYLSCFNKVFVVTDIMNERHKNSIDIWLPLNAKPIYRKQVLAILVSKDPN